MEHNNLREDIIIINGLYKANHYKPDYILWLVGK